MIDRPHHRRGPLAATLLLASLLAAACERGPSDDEFSAIQDTTALVESMGEVSLTADGAIEGEVTSGRYRRYLRARQALVRANVALPSAQRLRGYGPDDVRKLVAQLERSARARAAISEAGMTVEDFVITGVALERQLALATGPQRRALEEAAAAPPLDPGLTEPYPDSVPQPMPLPEPVPEPMPQPELPRPLPTDPRPVPTPLPVPPTPAPRTPAEPRPAPRDTLRLEPVPAPARPETVPPASPTRPAGPATTPAEPR